MSMDNWTVRYEAARNWDDPHWEASERKDHRRYVDALKAAIEALSERTGEWIPQDHNKTNGIASTILLGCLIFAAIIAHIKYMCWARQCFAVGGEWVVYCIAAVGFVWWAIDNDY